MDKLEKGEIWVYDEEIIRQLIASGIDMNVFPKAELIKYVREYWPLEVINPKVSNTVKVSVETKDSESYYENVAAAAASKNRKLTELFLATGFIPSESQKEEIERYLSGNCSHVPRGYL